nr:fructose-bisphosphatase class II [candidate division Zixibacteria bacterium]
MDSSLRYNIADQRIVYNGRQDREPFTADQLVEFNQRHKAVLAFYDIILESCEITTLGGQVNYKSNLGALRNRQLRQSVILSAALPAMAVGIHGRASVKRYSEKELTSDIKNDLKRTNDRTAAQIMAEVLQLTTETFPPGEEILIESTITEGVRVKPGKEPGGNPTIAVGAVFGKKQHRMQYGLMMPRDVTLLSMGSDVVEGTTKSIMGTHSSMTALFVTESHVKRHLPDIYVQRWMSGAHFHEFNPRELNLVEAAEVIARSYGHSRIEDLSSFFLDRPRHYPAMEMLNAAGVATPFDKDGDLMPGMILGLDGVKFPDGRGLNSMIGEIGGSAEWAIGVLPLVWRGGQALGMLTSQSSLTNKNLSPDDQWKERFHFTEDEFIMIQDARFERKPYFTIFDIVEDPYAGGIGAFGAITDNYFIPFMKGVEIDRENNRIKVHVLVINSLGTVSLWQFVFKTKNSLEHTADLLKSPKEALIDLKGKELEKAIGRMLEDPVARKRFRIFFNNEYYPALIPVRDKMVLLHKAVRGLIERDALKERNLEIVETTERMAPEWFTNSD